MRQLRQRPMLAVYLALLIIVTAGTIDLAAHWLNSRADDRLTVIANLLSLGTFALALVAGIIALAAYIAATGQPDLKVQFTLGHKWPNIGRVDMDGRDARVVTEGIGEVVNDLPAEITIKNSSGYAARSPAVLIEFKDGHMPESLPRFPFDGWTSIRNDARKVVAFQWDGGPNYAIHGNSYRYLPEINLVGLIFNVGDLARAAISIKVMADGYNRKPVIIEILPDIKRGPLPRPWL